MFPNIAYLATDEEDFKAECSSLYDPAVCSTFESYEVSGTAQGSVVTFTGETAQIAANVAADSWQSLMTSQSEYSFAGSSIVGNHLILYHIICLRIYLTGKL